MFLERECAVGYVTKLRPTERSSEPCETKETIMLHGSSCGCVDDCAHEFIYSSEKTARDLSFHLGDRVCVHNPRRKKGLSPKLQSHWEGPYEVVKVLNEVNV